MLKRVTLILLVGIALLMVFQLTGIAQEEEQIAPKNPLLYGVASFVVPGAGQFLNGETNKALTHFLIAVAIPTVGYYAAFASPAPGLVVGVTAVAQLGWALYSAMDAYNIAKQFNEEHGFAALYMQNEGIGFLYSHSF